MGATKEKNISGALFGKTRQAVLSILFDGSDRRFYLRQLSRMTGAGLGAVQRELKTLSESGIVSVERDGRNVYYYANPACPVFGELKSMVRKTSGLTGAIGLSLKSIEDKIEVAFIYGSMARMDETNKSDVDLMVVGDVSFQSVVDATAEAQNAIGREINPTVYKTMEFRDKILSGNNFLVRAMEGPKIFLIGDEDELDRLAK